MKGASTSAVTDNEEGLDIDTSTENPVAPSSDLPADNGGGLGIDEPPVEADVVSQE